MAANPAIPVVAIQPWRKLDDVPAGYRRFAGDLIELLIAHNLTGEAMDDDTRASFLTRHVFHNRWHTKSYVQAARALRSRVGDHVSVVCGRSRMTGQIVRIKPSIKKDANYPAFLYVTQDQKTVQSEDIDLDPEHDSIDAAKIAAMERWDEAEVQRVTAYNEGVVVYWARRRLVKIWRRESGDREAAMRYEADEDLDQLLQLKTMYQMSRRC